MSQETTSQTSQTRLSDVPDYQAIYIPKSTYKHKVVEAEFGKSKSSGNPMFTLNVEICDHPGFPNPKDRAKIQDPNGTSATCYMSLTEKALPALKKWFKAMGLPTDITLDDLTKTPNPSIFIGRTFLALGGSKADAQTDEITGQPVVNPATGQPVVYYRYNVIEVFAM